MLDGMAVKKRAPLVTLAVVAGLLLLAFLLNPSPERHRDRIRQAVGARSPIAAVLGLGSLAAFASSYHDLGLASYTTAGDQVLSVGAFGYVHVRELRL
jgi:hypothetical protein